MRNNRGQIEVKFRKELYSLAAIKESIKAYKEFAEFSLREEKNYFRVLIKKFPKELAVLIEPEFCNFVLFNMKRGF